MRSPKSACGHALSPPFADILFLWYHFDMMATVVEINQIGLTEAENQLAYDIEAWLEETNPEDCKLVSERFSRLRTLGAAVFSYP